MQSSFLNSTLADKNLSEIPNFKYVLLTFIPCFPSHVHLFRISLSFGVPVICVPRLLLKQLVTMEVIQWTTLWDTYKSDFENEKASGKSLGEKAAEDLRQRIIEHVNNWCHYISSHPSILLVGIVWYALCFILLFVNINMEHFCYLSEYSCCIKILCKNYIEETCRAFVPQYTGLWLILVVVVCF